MPACLPWLKTGPSVSGTVFQKHSCWFPGPSQPHPLAWIVAVLLQAKRGGLKDTDAVDLLATVFKGVLAQTKINPAVRVSSLLTHMS